MAKPQSKTDKLVTEAFHEVHAKKPSTLGKHQTKAEEQAQLTAIALSKAKEKGGEGSQGPETRIESGVLMETPTPSWDDPVMVEGMLRMSAHDHQVLLEESLHQYGWLWQKLANYDRSAPPMTAGISASDLAVMEQSWRWQQLQPSPAAVVPSFVPHPCCRHCWPAPRDWQMGTSQIPPPRLWCWCGANEGPAHGPYAPQGGR